ncbi:sulfotransferase family 2 domain-containing protein [Haloferula sp. BvORR071]|uniref:sulfotransferase family 2 domain-containing protein n=1 Tax=Haloferula sp. BvORR071 TaxID=1396141 RepID=UPI002240F39F|nr:sulfotransferase family 2 domain-containing protein [Haloferula sp. BvORR071]
MLVFVHIPKTAGTTLHKVISHQYRRRDILIRHDSDGPVAETLAGRTGAPPQVVMGHYSVGLHRHVPGLRYITCLREPVGRLISHYHYAASFTGHYLHQAIHREKLDLAGYVSSGLAGELSNGMTRMLAGLDDVEQPEIGDAELAMAKENIERHFDGVLLNDRFDEGLLLLAERLGWKTPYYLRRRVGNYPVSATKLDAATRKLIEDQNAIDLQLYAWAKSRFEDLAASRPDLAERTAAFKKRNLGVGRAIFIVREARCRAFG